MSRYLGQCDVLRRRSAAMEVTWQAMMAAAKPISTATFLRSVDLSPLLDDGESAREFLNNAKATDPETATFKSYWGSNRCWFLQTAGFEFIFLA